MLSPCFAADTNYFTDSYCRSLHGEFSPVVASIPTRPFAFGVPARGTVSSIVLRVPFSVAFPLSPLSVVHRVQRAFLRRPASSADGVSLSATVRCVSASAVLAVRRCSLVVYASATAFLLRNSFDSLYLRLALKATLHLYCLQSESDPFRCRTDSGCWQAPHIGDLLPAHPEKNTIMY